VDYIAKLPVKENPPGMFKQFPQLIDARDEQAREHNQIHLMISLDNWRWMPVRQASRLTDSQDPDDLKSVMFLAKMQFGKRLILLDALDAQEIIPPEGNYETNGKERTTEGAVLTDGLEVASSLPTSFFNARQQP
jgi:hypothetical protein